MRVSSSLRIACLLGCLTCPLARLCPGADHRTTLPLHRQPRLPLKLCRWYAAKVIEGNLASRKTRHYQVSLAAGEFAVVMVGQRPVGSCTSPPTARFWNWKMSPQLLNPDQQPDRAIRALPVHLILTRCAAIASCCARTCSLPALTSPPQKAPWPPWKPPAQCLGLLSAARPASAMSATAKGFTVCAQAFVLTGAQTQLMSLCPFL